MALSSFTASNAASRGSVKEPAIQDSARAFPDSGADALRVLHVHSGNIYGGIEAMLLTQVRQRDLCPSMENSFALCFAGQLSRELAAAGASVHWLGRTRIRQPLSLRRARRRLRELLRREAFDVVVTHSCWSQAIFGAAARAAGAPLVFYQHGPARGRHWLERWARRASPDAAICNSRFTAATASQLCPQLRAEVIYCPVAQTDANSAKTDAAETRAELQTPPDATVIIQVSRMESWKGQALHLEALARLKHIPGWVCWQVGGAQTDGEKKFWQELKEQAEELGIAERVRFPGQRADVGRLLAAADIFCQPNIGAEPFGIAFIEALYARLPVVTTALGGALEIVDDTCGVLVPPGDASALAEALRRLVEERDERARLGSAGPQRARELCDPATQMKQLHATLSRAVRQRRANG
ncbi:MAG TPA: glycosyltransferase family 4 protein [Pyrinomonadaceae bacterium]